MINELLQKIENPAARKNLGALLNNGFSLSQDHIKELLSGGIESRYLQVFPTVKESQIIKNINLDLSEAENLLLIVEGDPGLHWKATELVNAVTEKSSAKVIWNFHPSTRSRHILKVVALSY